MPVSETMVNVTYLINAHGYTDAMRLINVTSIATVGTLASAMQGVVFVTYLAIWIMDH